jgi:hypothetical protein
LIAAYLIESGLLLAVAPWTAWWARNFFAEILPWVRAAMANNGVRGGVALVGVATAIVGLRDLREVLFGGGHAVPPDGSAGRIP